MKDRRLTVFRQKITFKEVRSHNLVSFEPFFTERYFLPAQSIFLIVCAHQECQDSNAFAFFYGSEPKLSSCSTFIIAIGSYQL